MPNKQKQTVEFLEAWNNLNEAYMSRAELIKELQTYGCNYNFEKFTDSQLYQILQKTKAKADQVAETDYEYELSAEELSRIEKEANIKTIKKCDTCGLRLNDAGECPLCDLGDESVLDD